jgi:16S rRNA (uracil1498-N3)-methyltransferase
VLRLRIGDLLSVSDGAGAIRACRFGPELAPCGEVERHPRPEPAITIAFALPKADRPEDVVRKLTEVGIDRIVPMVSARSVVRWDPPRAGRNVERLRRVAREAAMQSRRVWLPVVDDVRPFAAVAGEQGAVLADRDGQPPSLDSTVVLIGPEGGWSDEERSLGLPRMQLADSTLRAETAAIAAGVLLGALRSHLISPR